MLKNIKIYWNILEKYKKKIHNNIEKYWNILKILKNIEIYWTNIEKN